MRLIQAILAAVTLDAAPGLATRARSFDDDNETTRAHNVATYNTLHRMSGGPLIPQSPGDADPSGGGPAAASSGGPTLAVSHAAAMTPETLALFETIGQLRTEVDKYQKMYMRSEKARGAERDLCDVRLAEQVAEHNEETAQAAAAHHHRGGSDKIDGGGGKGLFVGLFGAGYAGTRGGHESVRRSELAEHAELVKQLEAKEAAWAAAFAKAQSDLSACRGETRPPPDEGRPYELAFGDASKLIS
jgi:hypothetical protein